MMQIVRQHALRLSSLINSPQIIGTIKNPAYAGFSFNFNSDGPTADQILHKKYLTCQY